MIKAAAHATIVADLRVAEQCDIQFPSVMKKLELKL